MGRVSVAPGLRTVRTPTVRGGLVPPQRLVGVTTEYGDDLGWQVHVSPSECHPTPRARALPGVGDMEVASRSPRVLGTVSGTEQTPEETGQGRDDRRPDTRCTTRKGTGPTRGGASYPDESRIPEPDRTRATGSLIADACRSGRGSRRRLGVCDCAHAHRPEHRLTVSACRCPRYTAATRGHHRSRTPGRVDSGAIAVHHEDGDRCSRAPETRRARHRGPVGAVHRLAACCG